MSEQKEWNDKEVLIPSVEGIKKSSPLKEILTDQLKSFIEVAQDSDFPIQNLPFGVFSQSREGKRNRRAVYLAYGQRKIWHQGIKADILVELYARNRC